MGKSQKNPREVRDKIIERDHEILLKMNSGSRKIRVKPK